jgi:4-hydroxy-tetrahydrodipicolinate reductase
MTSLPALLIHGCRGRMGRALLDMAAADNHPVAAAVDAGDDMPAALALAAVAIDFSVPRASLALVETAAATGKPVVIGTTGHNAEERASIVACTRHIPIVWAGNYSVGVNVLLHLARIGAEALGAGFDPEIIEWHHRHKKDAPSGTALNLADAVRAAPPFAGATLVDGRSGISGERPLNEIGMHAVRGGEIIGDHTVYFIGAEERIELTHRAASRAIFAAGALRAARWVATQPAGLYDMRDVLGLKMP